MLVDMEAVAALYRRKKQAWLNAHAAAVSEEHLKRLYKTLLGAENPPRPGGACKGLVDPQAAGWGPEQEAELKAYLDAGFLDWCLRDLVAFKNAMLQHGGRWADIGRIQRAMPHKEPLQVERYFHAFWERGPKLLRMWPSILRQLDEAERLHSRQSRMLRVCCASALRSCYSA